MSRVTKTIQALALTLVTTSVLIPQPASASPYGSPRSGSSLSRRDPADPELTPHDVPRPDGRFGPCPTSGPWVWPGLVGSDNDGGDKICETHYGTDWDFIKTIDVWANDDMIRGLRVTYSGGVVSGMYGEQDDKYQSLTLDAGVKIDALALWGSRKWGRDDESRLGHIYIHASDGKTMDIGADKDGIPEIDYPPNWIGGGYLM